MAQTSHTNIATSDDAKAAASHYHADNPIHSFLFSKTCQTTAMPASVHAKCEVMLRNRLQNLNALLPVLLVVCGASTVFGQEPASQKVLSLIDGRVTLVSDGDDIEVTNGRGEVFPIRLQGIDAPEEKQPFGKEARENLSRLVSGKSVQVLVHKKDPMNRYIASVYRKGEDVNIKQIEAGLAWHYKIYSGEQSAEERERYSIAEAAAREKRIGLWKDDKPVPPWEFRGEKPVQRSATVASSQPASTATKKEFVTPATDAAPPAPTNVKYTLGPRGGCYYVNADRRKVYVNKSFCGQ